MYISKVSVKNFRLLRDTTLDLREKLSLLVGRNNTGKTSLIVLFDNFFDPKKPFHYDDFPISLRDKINNINVDTPSDELSIQMRIEIKYNKYDDLAELSEFILDLDPKIDTVTILFECMIKKDLLLIELKEQGGVAKKKFIAKNLHRFLETKIYSMDGPVRVEKDLKAVKKVINLQIIDARREVASSDDKHTGKRPLSSLTTKYFNGVNDEPNEALDAINKLVENVDGLLDVKYEPFFDDFLKNAKTFLDEDSLRVVSDIQSKSLLSNSSKVIYGDNDSHLPEHLNGLGVMNILHLLLTIEMKAADFKNKNKDINILFIEEPEAHTHPQMQYVFAKKIQPLLEKIDRLQSLITTHSSHIVSQSDFEDIRYLKRDADDVKFKNFYTELVDKYPDTKQFDFLNQYITLQASDLFFASKVIFIEGLTERMLLPHFMDKVDIEHKGKVGYDPLSSQNISILEVGANARVFAPFIEFLGVRTLIITDIDGVKRVETPKEGKDKPSISYPKKSTSEATHTSNETIKYYYNAPKVVNSLEFESWFKKIVEGTESSTSKNIKITYQTKEGDYHARSFEDAFISINKGEIQKATANEKLDVLGLKNLSAFDDPEFDTPFKLTDQIMDKKSDFASSLLYLALVEGIVWQTPSYIKGGLEWLSKD